MTAAWTAALKEMHLQTDLTGGAEIVVPPGTEWEPLAARLREQLRARAGAELPVVSGEQAALSHLQSRHWVLLGSAVDNPALAALYRRQCAFVDDFYPGGDGYVLRTVHNPFNCGHNLLLIGASQPRGAEIALDRLDRLLTEDGAPLGYVNLSNSTTHAQLLPSISPAEFRQRTRDAFAANAGRGPIEQAISLGLAHHLTGDPACAAIFRDTLFYYQDLVHDRYGGEFCFEHMLFIYAWTWRLFYIWDLIEESDAFAAADRLRMTELLWGLTHYVAGLSYFQSKELPPREIRQNHWTFAALSMSFSAGYFATYYDIDIFAHQLEYCRAIFDGQADCYKPNDDGGGGGYCWLVPNHLLTYDLRQDDERFAAGGHLRRLADYALLITDNLGSPVGFGDVGSYGQRRRASTGIAEVLCKAAWHYREGGYLWALDWMGGTPQHGGYYRDLPRREPTWMTGLSVAPLTPPMHAWVRDHAPAGANIPQEESFDKLTLRDGFGEEDLYLLLDGTSTFAHGHDDGNSIERLTWKGRMWLAETDYIWRRPRHHSSVVSICDARSTDPPALVSLGWAEDFGRIGLTRTTTPDYNGVDWIRDLLWARGRFLLVADALHLRQEADYDLRCLWRTLGEISLEESDLRVEQQSVFFRIANADDSEKSLEIEAERVPGQDPYASYDYADGPTGIFVQQQTLRGRPGEVVRYFNLLVAGTVAEIDACSIERIAADLVRIEDPSGALIFGTAPAPIAVGPWRIAADAFVLTDTEIVLLGATTFGHDQFDFASPTPVHLTASPTAGRGELRVPTATRVQVRHLPGASIDGQTSTDGSLEVSLSPGTYPLSFAPATLDILSDIPSTDPPRPPVHTPRQNCFTGTDRPAFETAWERQLNGSVRCADLCKERIAVGTEAGELVCLKRGGDAVWKASLEDRVQTVHLAEFDGEPVLLAGGRDCALTRFDIDGSVCWKRDFAESHHRDQIVNAVTTADLTNTGENTILVATDGWLVWNLDPSGQELWQRQIEHHAALSLVVEDEQGDGKREILVGTEYYNANLLEADGRIRWTVRGGPGFTALAMEDLDGDGVRESIYGSMDGNVYVYDSLSGQLKWTANLGDDVGHAAVLPIDGKKHLIAGSESGNVALLTPTGERIWRRDLDAPVTGLALMPGDGEGRIAASTAAGWVVLFSREGELLGGNHLEAGITVLRCCGPDLLVGTAAGQLLLFRQS